ncbi:hypothetical protein FKM82_013487 [Ascaphus truei]
MHVSGSSLSPDHLMHLTCSSESSCNKLFSCIPSYIYFEHLFMSPNKPSHVKEVYSLLLHKSTGSVMVSQITGKKVPLFAVESVFFS